MSAQFPSPVRAPRPTAPPFPTRGVAGGWKDPWDPDPIDALAAALSPHGHAPATRPEEDSPRRLARGLTEAGCHVALLALVRGDGRWEARVASWEPPRSADLPAGLPILWAEVVWPSVNGPTAAVALDALEGEVRELVQATLLGAVSPAAGILART